jgi:FkbM family methyltransferase
MKIESLFRLIVLADELHIRAKGTRTPSVVFSRSHHHPISLIDTHEDFFLVPSDDSLIGPNLASRGTYDPTEKKYILDLLSTGDSVIECGANIGVYSVPIAKKIGRSGHLYCFEPFRLIFQILTANIALNGIANVYTFNVGASNETVTSLLAAGPNLTDSDNYGAASLLDEDNKTWILKNPHWQNVSLVILDDQIHDFPAISLLKIDAEGMEFEVVKGAINLIQRDHPVLYVENSTGKRDNGISFEDFMKVTFNYTCSRPAELRIHNIVLCRP